MRTIFLLSAILLLLFAKVVPAQNFAEKDYYVKGITNPVVDLSGTWKLNLHPEGRFWENNELDDSWKDIQVPGEPMMQGFPIRHDTPFAYKTFFLIPPEFDERLIMLRFEGVYSYTRVWVNGQFVRDHHGGFTTWDCDITPFVSPGETAYLTLEVTDRADEISYASGYAKHQIGGILRNVKLMALPRNHLQDITIITDLDRDFRDATLVIRAEMRTTAEKSRLLFELYDGRNIRLELKDSVRALTQQHVFEIKNHIPNPWKWNSEYPYLYTLKVSSFDEDGLQWYRLFKVGFREVQIEGNRLLVNGRQVKLRGADRHDIHPLLGRVSTPEYELKDVQLAKEANMNFIRTSHYPPSDHFLRLCDEYGLYVEDETAVCFVGSHRTEEYRPGDSENDPTFTERYLSQLREMVDSHKNHPSVIIWSIGNENAFGDNFRKSYVLVKATDDTRPVIFSYPGNVPEGTRAYDIISMHYPDTEGNLNQYGVKTHAFGYPSMPVIFDEWAHVACYNNFTVKEDPNIRDFWGRSLDIMWQKTFESDGGLGGAIWCMIDETFTLPNTLPGFKDWWGKIDNNVIPAEYSGHTVGYGEWGIVDTWRRKKPEFWNTKKAYSPVRLLKTEFDPAEIHGPLKIPVLNRFDHTDIRDLFIIKRYGEEVKYLTCQSIKPHEVGLLETGIDEWDPSIPVYLEFYTHQWRLIDAYALTLKAVDKDTIGTGVSSMPAVHFEEKGETLTVICENNTRILFDKDSGLIHQIQTSSDTLEVNGPHLNLRTKGEAVMYSYHTINDHGKEWKLKDFEYHLEKDHASVDIKGFYDKHLPVGFKVKIFGEGKLDIQYDVDQVPDEYIREIGIIFKIGDVFDSLSWSRRTYWSYYPEDHLSAKSGWMPLYAKIQKKYREEPLKGWNEDSKSFYYDGNADEIGGDQLTNIARATKEGVDRYALHRRNSKQVLAVEGNGNVHCRLEKREDKIFLFLNNEMDYVDLSWGNYQRNIKLAKKYRNEVFLAIH